MNHFVEQPSQLIDDAWKRIGKPRRILLALSGGADSVALFSALLSLSHLSEINLACVHVDYGLRITSQDDANFCRLLCEKHHVPFFLKKVVLSGKGENEARHARYLAISSVYREWHADVLALAHHGDDQAETVLRHLFRGCGMQGLCGMRELSQMDVDSGTPMSLWRPLLQCTNQSLLQTACYFSHGWCQDETNLHDRYMRNYLRNRLLPMIVDRFPRAKQAICRTATILQDENALLESMVQSFIEQHVSLKPPVPWILYQPFAALHQSLQRRVLAHFLPVGSEYEHIEAVLSMSEGETINVLGDLHIKHSGAYLCLYSNHVMPQPLPPLYVQRAFGRTGDGKHQQALPAQLLKKCQLRFRKNGDVIQPFGMNGTRKLQDYLTDKKVPQPMRDHLPMLCADDRIIWVIGVGAGEEVRCAESEDTLLLTYSDRLPFEM